MPSIEIRPFRRDDRDQVAGLVNRHVEAVVPGVTVSVNAVMSQLEREPGEFVVDPWVVERRTLVAIERDAVAAAALLLRYGGVETVGEAYRDVAEIRWLVFGPESTTAAAALLEACLATMDAWSPARELADGSLPGMFVYGIPACWPHVRELLVGGGFEHLGRVEILSVADVDDLPRPGEPPLPGLEVRRSVGVCGTRFSAMLADEAVGYVEVAADYTGGGTLSRLAGWSDIGNLCVREQDRRRGVATWLLGHAADWLRLGHADRLVAYAWPEQTDELGFYAASGFRELVRTERGWQRRPG